MTDTETLITQAARELQLTLDSVTTKAAEPDLTAMTVINTYAVVFKRRNGDQTTVDITDGNDYIEIHDKLKAAFKGMT